jgi:DNA (cytosine-5)-methyltransferase 1
VAVCGFRKQPVLIDFYCCEGGASEGYSRAGWSVVGVDKEDQPNYPFPFHKGDTLDVMRRLIDGEAVDFHTRDGLVIWLTREQIVAAGASPPCQAHSTITPDKSKHVDLIPPTRELLHEWGIPFVMENVEGAKRALENPVKLCGSSFGLRVRRHRMFESNVYLTSIPCAHGQQGVPVGVYGDHADGVTRRPNGTSRGVKAQTVDEAREAMGMPWASWHGATQAIPPAYTEFLGRQLLAHVREEQAA